MTNLLHRHRQERESKRAMVFWLNVATIACNKENNYLENNQGLLIPTHGRGCCEFHVSFPSSFVCGNALDLLSPRKSSVLHRVRIVKLLTQHVVRGDSWVPTNGSPPCWWWGYQSVNCVHDCRFPWIVFHAAPPAQRRGRVNSLTQKAVHSNQPVPRRSMCAGNFHLYASLQL